MKCQDIQDQLLADFLDHELPSDKKSVIEGHLLDCAHCREFFAAVNKVNDPLGADEAVQPDAHVWARVRDQVEATPFSMGEKIRAWFEEVLWGFRPTFVYGSIVAAMCVILIVPIGLYRQEAIAMADKEELMQLVYVDDSMTTATGAEGIGNGTVVEHWL
jgi:anti-sigma factor RsiW